MFLGDGACEIESYIPVRLSASLAGRNQLFPPFSQLKKAIPNLTDAFISPRGDTLIVLTNAKIRVFDISKAKLGAKLLEVDFPSDAISVMDQWAVGAHVKDWTQQIRKWETHPPPAPIISAR